MKNRWITDEPPERDGLLDVLDSGRYHPDPEGTEVPKRETYVPVDPDLAPADTPNETSDWPAIAVFCMLVLGFVAVVQMIVGAR